MLLDTVDIAPQERAAAIADTVAGLGLRCAVRQERDGAGMHARLDAHVLGVLTTLRYAGTGIRLSQSDRQARAAAVDVLAVAVQGRRPGRHTQFGRRAVLRPGELLLVDRGSAFEYGWHGDGGAVAVNIPFAELGLAREVVRRAASRLAASPLIDLVGEHIRGVCSDAAQLAGDAGRDGVGRATAELVRALVLTAASAEHGRTTAAVVLRSHGLPPGAGTW